MFLRTLAAEMTQLSAENRRVSASLFLWAVGEGLFIYLVPLYLRELGAQPVTIGVILGVSAVAAAVTPIPGGYLADRLGRKPIFVFAFALGTVAALAMALAPGLTLFVPPLVIYYSTTFLMAPLTAYVAEARGSQSVQRAISLVMTSYWAALIFSPTLGGLLARQFGTRALFGVASALFVVAVVVLLGLPPQPSAPPPPGQGRYTALFRNRRLLGFLGLMLAAVTSLHIGFPLMTNFVVDVRGFDVGVAGMLGSVNSLGSTLLHLVLGARLPRRAFLLGLALQALALVGLLTTASLPWLLVVYFLRAGWYVAHNMALAQVSRVVASAELGMALGLTETCMMLSLVVGPLIAGPLYQRAPALPFQVSLALLVIVLPVVWRFAPRREQSGHEQPAAGPAANAVEPSL
jgi:predicted MFS family arabinose efflux permease